MAGFVVLDLLPKLVYPFIWEKKVVQVKVGPNRNNKINSSMTDSLRDLTLLLEQFATEREWQPFHSPKNLASALVVEAGELLEHFQWLTEAQSREVSVEKREFIASEIADVLLYLIQLSNALGIDPIAAAQSKVRANALKYPVDKARGSSKKYDEL